jgi:hypothetical protein
MVTRKSSTTRSSVAGRKRVSTRGRSRSTTTVRTPAKRSASRSARSGGAQKTVSRRTTSRRQVPSQRKVTSRTGGLFLSSRSSQKRTPAKGKRTNVTRFKSNEWGARPRSSGASWVQAVGPSRFTKTASRGRGATSQWESQKSRSEGNKMSAISRRKAGRLGAEARWEKKRETAPRRRWEKNYENESPYGRPGLSIAKGRRKNIQRAKNY